MAPPFFWGASTALGKVQQKPRHVLLIWLPLGDMAMAEISLVTYILFALIVLLGIVIAGLMCTFLLVLHEYGHVYAMTRAGIKPDYVVIGWPVVFKAEIGGLSHHYGLLPVFGYVYSDELQHTSSQKKAQVALAGPITSFLVGVFLLSLYFLLPQNQYLYMSGLGSLILAGLNLVPLPPMDGWYIVKHWMEQRGIKLTSEVEYKLFVAGIAFIWLSVLLVSSIDFIETHS